MNFEAYQQKFIDILSGGPQVAPYDGADYVHYVKLNLARQQRWLKTGVVNNQLALAITNIEQEQIWTVITEPFCGDAAHTLPFVHRLTELNPLIKVDYQLRDSSPFLIDEYLTNGKKSIPKLIINDGDRTIGVWGSRPIACQALFDQLQHAHVDTEQKKLALQQWYNEDKGAGFQKELLEMINSKDSPG